MKATKLFVLCAALICTTTIWATDYSVGTDKPTAKGIYVNNGRKIVIK